MEILAIVVGILVLLALAGAELLVSNISADELGNMGVHKKP